MDTTPRTCPICRESHEPRPTRDHYIEAARRMYAIRSDDDLEIDDAPALSETDTGSWVAAWVYVRDEDVTDEDRAIVEEDAKAAQV